MQVDASCARVDTQWQRAGESVTNWVETQKMTVVSQQVCRTRQTAVYCLIAAGLYQRWNSPLHTTTTPSFLLHLLLSPCFQATVMAPMLRLLMLPLLTCIVSIQDCQLTAVFFGGFSPNKFTLTLIQSIQPQESAESETIWRGNLQWLSVRFNSRTSFNPFSNSRVTWVSHRCVDFALSAIAGRKNSQCPDISAQ